MKFRILAAIPLLITLVLIVTMRPTTVTATPSIWDKLSAKQRTLLSGFAEFELNPANAATANQLSGFAPQSPLALSTSYFPTNDKGCHKLNGTNVQVNQNCLNLTDPDLQGRGQAENETSIAADRYNPQHIMASYNDYRRGDGGCYGSYTLDGGNHWFDTTIPFSFTRAGTTFSGGSRQYWQAGGDTSVAWDTKGNVYLSCQVFNRGKPPTTNPDLSSALLLFRSTQNDGASWNFPARYVEKSADLNGTGISPFEDKQLMTVDNHKGSPFQDRVYVSWTEFTASGTAFIYESYSADYGETFSARVLVSTPNASLCTVNYGIGGANDCNANQFSQPFTGPDGALYVVWVNFNNPEAAGNTPDNRNQILLAKSTDGGATFGPSLKVADYYDLPDCPTYTGKNAGRACVPTKGSTQNSYFRATNYPSGVVNPKNASQVMVAFGSYINQHSKESNGCVPTGFSGFGLNTYTGVTTPGACNNDILLSVSNDGGASFTGTTVDPRNLRTVGPATATDQFWQWIDMTAGGKVAISYFDRQYGNDELNGFSDVSLSSSSDLSSWTIQRATSSSMPPPTQFSGTFYGDYTGLTAVHVGVGVDYAYPLWMDTREKDLFLCPGTAAPGVPPQVCTATSTNAAFANDQNAYTQRLTLP